MNSNETPIIEPVFTLAALRPLASLIVFAAIAMLALFGAATVATAKPVTMATDSAIIPATLDIPASPDEPMAAFGQ